MENTKSVNLYVYTTVDSDGNETYSYPFSAIDDYSALRMIAHTLAYSKRCEARSFTLRHVYQIGIVEYVSSFTVAFPSLSDLCLLVNHSEVHFDHDVYQRDFDYFFNFLSNFSMKSEEKSNA